MSDNAREIECPKCDGSGYTYEWNAPLYGEDLSNSNNNYDKVPCKKCNGTGKITQTLRWV